VKRCGSAVVLAYLLSIAGAAPAMADGASDRGFSVELEAGPAWQGHNDVEIPNDGTGTRFAVEDLAGRGPLLAYRAYLSYDFNEKHGLRVLFAPLTVEGNGRPARSIDFDGETFAAGVPADATYLFNSYRVTYRYRIHDGARFRWHAGITAKIREAEVALSQGSTAASYDNVGFVPLLHGAGEWKASDRWSVTLDADAAAAPQGRAEDVALKAAWRLNDRLSASAGYRMVEGGADIDKVYTFAWIHYAVASVRYEF
jgi:hypothetical protein